jgi:hypothetical protein
MDSAWVVLLTVKPVSRVAVLSVLLVTTSQVTSLVLPTALLLARLVRVMIQRSVSLVFWDMITLHHHQNAYLLLVVIKQKLV